MAELILKLKDREIKRINISKIETTMGRDPDCDLFIDNIGISREHAKIIYRNARYFLRDNGSSNGTFLNNTKIASESEIYDRDEIQLGKYRVIFSSAGGMPEHLLGIQDDDIGKKKVRNVFGTVQFSADEIQNLLVASGDSPKPSVQIPSRPVKQYDQYDDDDEISSSKFDKQTILNIVLSAIIGILILILVIVLIIK
jgi:hypothetical protein